MLGSARNAVLLLTRNIRRLAATRIWLLSRAEALLVKSLEDLQALCNHNMIDDNSNLKFSYSTFSFVTNKHTAYWSRLSIRKFTLDVVNESLGEVAEKDIYPEMPSHITNIMTIDSGFLIKVPALKFHQKSS